MNESVNETITKIPEILGTAVPISGIATLDMYVITLFASLFITLVNKYLSDQVKIRALRAEMKHLQKDMKKVMAKDPKKAQKIQKEIFKKNLENMKHAMDPKILLITMAPMLLLFFFVREYYGPLGDFFTPFGLVSWGWLGTYLLFSIFNSIVLKKVLDVA